MRNFQLSMACITSMAILLGCSQTTPETVQTVTPTSIQVEQTRIKAHIEFLADDTLKGRDTGSIGYQVAANYVTSTFKQYGLTPMGGNNTFEQQVNFRKTTLNSDSPVFEIMSDNGVSALSYPEQFVMSGSSLSAESLVKGKLVFVGYGIVSPEFSHDDYQKVDVKGKIVVVLKGRPDEFPSEEGAHLASTTEKMNNAAQRGAIGFITIHTPKREKVLSYQKIIEYSNRASFNWLTKDGQPFGSHPKIINSAYIDSSAAMSLFEGAERSLDDIFNDDSNNVPISGFNLNVNASMNKKSQHEQVSSPNVIAAIEGSDPTLKNEYVVFSAHLDHIGVSHDENAEDKINNGALDNASGVSILLETARLLSLMPVKPKRSILFVVVTAEERGLLGSSYFANNPTVPVKQMVANVNLDMPIILYPFADVIAFGATHSTMGDIVEKAAQKVDIKLSPDPMPEQALFTRSDHYSFVKAGIPSVFLVTGFTSKDPAIDGGKLFGDFIKNHYHQHSDELTLPIDYAAAATFVKVNMMIGLEIANQQTKPSWHAGDFFGKIFAH